MPFQHPDYRTTTRAHYDPSLLGNCADWPRGQRRRNPQTRYSTGKIQAFADAFEQIRSSYVNEVSDEDLHSAIRGMLFVDPHSAYLPPADLFIRDTLCEFMTQPSCSDNGLLRIVRHQHASRRSRFAPG